MPIAVRAADAAWSPTSQQSQEPDTTFMLDPAGDAALGLVPAFGGLLDASQGSNPPSVAAGKFLQGYRPSASNSSFYWMPSDGLLNPDEWTVEFWAQLTADWSTVANTTFLTLGSNSNYLQILLNTAGTLTAKVNHKQNPGAAGTYSISATASLTSGECPANTWNEVAVTLLGGVLTLVVNGSVVGTAAGVISPLYWSNNVTADGIWLPANISGGSSTSLEVSDPRISRRARAPGRATIISRSTSTVTITSTATGKTVQPLAGMLKALAWKDACGATPNAAIDAQQASLGVIKFARAGSFLQATPIRTFASGPSGTTSSLGHSGSYYYDWQVVDRTLRYWDSLGVEGYVNLTGTPQILGGTHGPWTDTVLTTTASPQAPDVSGTIAFTSSPPSDTTVLFGYGGNVYTFTGVTGSTASGCLLVSGTPGLSIPAGSAVHWGNLTTGHVFAKGAQNAGPPSSPSVATAITNLATMAGDLAYHIYTEMSPALSHPPVYWTPWNEPDGGVSWETGVNAQTDYQSLYGQIATAVTTVNASAKMAGPEVSNWATSGNGWIQNLITYCGANSKPLDAISWHFYSSDISEPYQMRLQVDAWCTAAGLATGKPFIAGEWDWKVSETAPWYQTGATPSDYMLNDWEATYSAAALIQMQAQNVIRAVGGNDSPNSQFVGWFDNSNGTPQVSWNAHRLWSMLYSTVVGVQGPQTVACDPGIHAIATTNGAGKYRVLIASLRYRKVKHDGSANTQPVLVTGIPVADGTSVIPYVVDDQHSNAYDAGTANASLQTTSTNLNAQGVNKVAGGQVGIVLRPRAAVLLDIG